MNILQRTRWFFDVSKRRASKISRREKASHDAEIRGLRVVQSLPFVHSAKHAIRIPDPQRQHGAGEVDVLALTERGFVLLEIKHWSGAVIFKDGDIHQHKRMGISKPLMPVLEKKVSNLKRNACTMIQDDSLEATKILLFTNPNVKLSDEVKSHPAVATLGNLSERVDSRISNFDLLSAQEMEDYAALLDCFGTWDSVSFDGGNVVIGDLRDSEMPEKWKREHFKRIKIKLKRGFLKTVLFGPQLHVELESWNGGCTSEIMDEMIEITHTSPWAKKSVQGYGKYPLEVLSEISHGYQHAAYSAASLEKLPKPEPVQNNQKNQQLSNQQHGNKSSDPYERRFKRGSNHKGIILKKLTDKNGNPYAFLIALVERKVRGIMQLRELDSVHPDLVDVLYAVGKPVEVQIRSYKGPQSIKLGIKGSE